MKGTTSWSFAPYKPLLFDIGDIYICRIAPTVNSIHIEWLGDGEYSVYYRKRGDGEFILAGVTSGNEFDITGLCIDTDYELYVSSGEKKSRVRLARCGESVGTVVNYLHPEDEAYSFSGRYLCSPSLICHPDGYMLSSMDLYAGGHPQNLTLIFRSDDGGENWHYVSELMPCFWGKMFLHRGELYMLAVSTEYGDLLIGKSTDGGKTFGTPTVLLRGSNGKNGNSGVHKNPENIMIYNGRIYQSLEWGTWWNKEYGHAPMIMSAPIDADLLDPESWSFAEPLKFDYWSDELKGLPMDTMMIEGTLVVAPDGRLKNIMRFGKYHKALVLDVDTDNPDAPLRFDRLMDFPGNYVKFMIKHDELSGYYYTIATIAYGEENKSARNYMSLLRSRDLVSWETVIDLFDYRHMPKNKVGFQYTDFEFSGDDIIFLCRTAMNEANSHHDTNYQTFHRIKNFRSAPKLV